MSPEGTDHTEGMVGAPPASARDLREAAVDHLVEHVQRGPGHVAVIGRSAEEAAGLFAEAEARLAIHRGVRVRGASLDESAALAALCADQEDADGRVGHAMRTLVQEARAAGKPVVVIVTEADRADPARLERLRDRLGWVPGAPEVTRMVLLGGPKLAAMLRRREARELGSLVAAVVQVPPDTTTAGTRRPRLAGTLARYAIGVVLALAAFALWPRSAPRPDVPALPAPVTVPVAIPEVAPTMPPPPPAPVVVPPVAEVAPAPEPTVPTPSAPPPAPPRPEVARETPIATEPSIQVGAFARVENAEALRAKLAPEFPGVYVSAIDRGGTTLHHVRIGGLTSPAEARAVVAALRRAGYAPARVRE